MGIEAIREVIQERYPLGSLALKKLETYVSLIERAPSNLTAWRGEAIWERGVLDSLAIWPILGSSGGMALDVGSGAGFPGLVLAVARPEWEWTLVESRSRRGAFLEEAVRALALSNVQVVVARAEEWIRVDERQRERFDVVTLRAVARTRAALELGLPFVRLGGKMVLVKGFEGLREVEAERQWLEKLGGAVSAWVEGSVSDVRGRRDQLVVLGKVSQTPGEYPRGAPKLGT
ncbi:MAG: 16S rRNA (guanine(527)-N(7))-methyltransferase RsmG [Firmicutes bacterium]|nr:16S rRNA (guanine(527)-N(7))-methyltransferase RsmG [Bacillota bacterium]